MRASVVVVSIVAAFVRPPDALPRAAVMLYVPAKSSAEDRQRLIKRAERIADLVADIAEDLTDDSPDRRLRLGRELIKRCADQPEPA